MKILKSLILLSISVLCFAESAQEEPTCLPPAQLSLSHHFGRGIGHKGYSSAEVFIIQANREDFSPFADLRLHVMNEGRFASNLGVGFRTLPWDRVSLGGNLYYDYRSSRHLHTHQVSGGFELLSEYLDFRLNGYLPVGGTKHADPLAFAGFSGNQINAKRKTYYAYPMIDGEFGVPLPWISPQYTDFYVAVGPYYLFGKNVSDNHYDGSWGFQGRLTAFITDYVELGFEYHYDRVYHSTYQGIVAVHIPLYKNTACRPKGGMNKGQKAFAKRTLRPVMRREIIPVKKKGVVRPLRDSNGNAIQAFFVNNLAACPGFGTFENPFCSTALAQAASTPGSLIYLFEGDGTTTNYDTAITLQEGQTLQGSGIPLTLGGVTIPAQTAGSPHLTSTGNGILLEDNTTVRGLILENTVFDSIYGSHVDNVLIEYNTVINSGSSAIEIQDHAGTITIRYNSIDGTVQNGISLDHSLNPGVSYIIGNRLDNYVEDGVLVRMNHPDAYALVSGNYFTRSISPTSLIGDIGTEIRQGYIEIVNNRIDSNTFWAVHALDGNQRIANNVVNNTSTYLTAPAISYITTGFAGSSRIATITDNQVSAIGTHDGIGVISWTAGVDTFAEVTGNQVTTADPTRGIQIFAESGNTNCAVLSGNTASTFLLQSNAPSVLNMQQTQAEYNGANTATTGFTEVGNVNFGTGCSGP
ncbi:MAG: right-handed parallel beta-helix repeat-containing protein [Chlamydiales bacterium]|nr:right-handed parallel beta-helix repeat-containing protein [Chlamydiales bacterium]